MQFDSIDQVFDDYSSLILGEQKVVGGFETDCQLTEVIVT